MGDILNARIVLRLNSGHQRIGWATVAEAIVAMMGGSQDDPPALALDIDYELGEDGKPNFEKISYFYAKKWDDWKEVSIREWDLSIGTVRGRIRVPTVIICPKFHKVPMKTLRPTKSAIRQRDGNKCQYTGKELTNTTASLDHVLPKSKGGQDTWENLVLCHKDLNSKKGNALNEEIGLKLLRKPFAPKPIPISQLITEVRHPDHAHF